MCARVHKIGIVVCLFCVLLTPSVLIYFLTYNQFKMKLFSVLLAVLLSLPFIINGQNLADLEKYNLSEVQNVIPDDCCKTVKGEFINRGNMLRIQKEFNSHYGFTGRNTNGILFKAFYRKGDNLYLVTKGQTRGLALSFFPKFEGQYIIRVYDRKKPSLIYTDYKPNQSNTFSMVTTCKPSTKI